VESSPYDVGVPTSDGKQEMGQESNAQRGK